MSQRLSPENENLDNLRPDENLFRFGKVKSLIAGIEDREMAFASTRWEESLAKHHMVGHVGTIPYKNIKHLDTFDIKDSCLYREDLFEGEESVVYRSILFDQLLAYLNQQQMKSMTLFFHYWKTAKFANRLSQEFIDKTLKTAEECL